MDDEKIAAALNGEVDLGALLGSDDDGSDDGDGDGDTLSEPPSDGDEGASSGEVSGSESDGGLSDMDSDGPGRFPEDDDDESDQPMTLFQQIKACELVRRAWLEGLIGDLPEKYQRAVFKCRCCLGATLINPRTLKDHIASKKHRKNVARFEHYETPEEPVWFAAMVTEDTLDRFKRPDEVQTKDRVKGGEGEGAEGDGGKKKKGRRGAERAAGGGTEGKGGKGGKAKGEEGPQGEKKGTRKERRAAMNKEKEGFEKKAKGEKRAKASGGDLATDATEAEAPRAVKKEAAPAAKRDKTGKAPAAKEAAPAATTPATPKSGRKTPSKRAKILAALGQQ